MTEAWEELRSAWTLYMARSTDGTVKNEQFSLFMSNAFIGEEEMIVITYRRIVSRLFATPMSWALPPISSRITSTSYGM